MNLNKIKPIFLVMALAAVLCLICVRPNMWIGGDDARYMILAKSIASGQGYRDINHPKSLPHTLYPFMFPLMLAPLILVFGMNVIILKLLIVALFIISIYFVFKLFKEHIDEKLALPMAMMYAFSYFAIVYSFKVTPGIPGLLFSVLAIIFFKKYEKEDKIFSKNLTLSVLFLLAASFTHPSGIVLIIAVLITIFISELHHKKLFKGYKTITLFFLTSIPIIAWMIRSKLVSVSNSVTYMTLFFLKDPYMPEAGKVALEDLLKRAINNILYYIRGIARIIFEYNEFVGKYIAITTIVLFSIFLIGFVYYIILRKMDIISWYVILFFGVLLVYPWLYVRYLISIIPFILYFFVLGIGRIVFLFQDSLDIKTSKKVFNILVILLIVIIFAGGLRGIVSEVQIKDDYYTNTFGWYYEAAMWAKENTESDAVFVARKPHTFYIWVNNKTTDRRAYNYMYISNPEAIMQEMADNNVDYVIIDELSVGTTERFLIPAIQKYQSNFTTVWSKGKTMVLKRNK